MSTENEKHTPDVEDEWLVVDEMHAKLIASVPENRQYTTRETEADGKLKPGG